MRVISTVAKGNNKRMTIELEPGEAIIVVKDGSHYKLGHPVEDVVSANVIAESQRVTWCSASQEWQPL